MQAKIYVCDINTRFPINVRKNSFVPPTLHSVSHLQCYFVLLLFSISAEIWLTIDIICLYQCRTLQCHVLFLCLLVLTNIVPLINEVEKHQPVIAPKWDSCIFMGKLISERLHMKFEVKIY